jgi:hypothetical protein
MKRLLESSDGAHEHQLSYTPMHPSDFLREGAKGRRDRVEFHLLKRDRVIISWLV